jgi:hypothetical protein
MASPLVGFPSFGPLDRLCVPFYPELVLLRRVCQSLNFTRSCIFLKVCYDTKFRCPELIGVSIAPISEICVTIILILLMVVISWLKLWEHGT